ncbi:hypothetical protein F4777DRAFT_594918 [Nemania sp. FL0916]|nr:hypothetical protein F4777DRAFT_594918 [Nemania sp. FL0916]
MRLLHRRLMARRNRLGIVEAPFITWEPGVGACHPRNLEDHYSTLELVDCFSPNHIELSQLLTGDAFDQEVRQELVEAQARTFVERGIGRDGQGLIVVRCGANGSMFMRNRIGTGSAFLGAFTVAMIETNSPWRSLFYGAVASSYAIQQYGLPDKSTKRIGERRFGIRRSVEVWNGSAPMHRLARMRRHADEEPDEDVAAVETPPPMDPPLPPPVVTPPLRPANPPPPEDHPLPRPANPEPPEDHPLPRPANPPPPEVNPPTTPGGHPNPNWDPHPGTRVNIPSPPPTLTSDRPLTMISDRPSTMISVVDSLPPLLAAGSSTDNSLFRAPPPSTEGPGSSVGSLVQSPSARNLASLLMNLHPSVVRPPPPEENPPAVNWPLSGGNLSVTAAEAGPSVVAAGAGPSRWAEAGRSRVAEARQYWDAEAREAEEDPSWKGKAPEEDPSGSPEASPSRKGKAPEASQSWDPEAYEAEEDPRGSPEASPSRKGKAPEAGPCPPGWF